MSTQIAYSDDIDMEEVFNLMCKCGHKLSHHGFVRGYGKPNHFWVSQCVLCPIEDGKFACEEFEAAEIVDAKPDTLFGFPMEVVDMSNDKVVQKYKELEEKGISK